MKTNTHNNLYALPTDFSYHNLAFFNKHPDKLLSLAKDAKTSKGIKKGVLTGILYMTPHTGSGINLCPMAHLAKCAAPCLNTAGRGKMSNVQVARLRKALMFNQHLAEFKTLLIKEVTRLVSKAKKEGLIPMVRLNGTTDIRWERVFPEIFEMFSDVQFYDYTKIPNRDVSHIPNYHLTWSYSGVSEYARFASVAVENGHNVAVVFRDKGTIPQTFLNLPVVDGDNTDIRPWDNEDSGYDQVVVALIAKGDAKKDTSGFVIDTQISLPTV